MTKIVQTTLLILTLLALVLAQPIFAAEQTAKSTVAATAPQKININTADAETLTQIKGIGPKTAERIVAHRQEIGAFAAIEDIVAVKGIGEKTFLAIKPFITVE